MGKRGPKPRPLAERRARRLAATRRAALKWWHKSGSERRARRHSKRKKETRPDDDLSIVDRPDTSPLKYIDARGRVHIEKELSAEELIRTWQRRTRKENRTHE
jgi:hypothetical protein